MSELRGRKLPLVISLFGFSVFAVGSATAKDLQTLMLCRFFMSVFGSCSVAVVAAVYADMYGPETRGLALTAFAASVFMGPMVAPFIGGFTGKKLGLIEACADVNRSDQLLGLEMGCVLVNDHGLRYVDPYGLLHARNLPTYDFDIHGGLSATPYHELGYTCQTRRS